MKKLKTSALNYHLIQTFTIVKQFYHFVTVVYEKSEIFLSKSIALKNVSTSQLA